MVEPLTKDFKDSGFINGKVIEDKNSALVCRAIDKLNQDKINLLDLSGHGKDGRPEDIIWYKYTELHKVNSYNVGNVQRTVSAVVIPKLKLSEV